MIKIFKTFIVLFAENVYFKQHGIGMCQTRHHVA